jgi:hypothetical protein
MSKAVVAAMESDFFEAAFLAGPWPALRDEHLQRFSWADTAEEREAVVRSLFVAVRSCKVPTTTREDLSRIAEQGRLATAAGRCSPRH